MNRLIRTLCLFGAAALASCIKEDLSECRNGDVTVRIRVEKFQTAPPYAPSDFEEHFNKRIDHADYLLYKGGVLIERGSLDGAANLDAPYAVFSRKGLEFGDYVLALTANCTPSTVDGAPENPNAYYVVYPGEKDDRDLFVCFFPFTVDCACEATHDAVLERVHGVVLCRVENIPSGITAVETEIGGVGSRRSLPGTSEMPVTVSKRFVLPASAQRISASSAIGVFPTPAGGRSTWRLKLYGSDGTNPVFDRLITDTLVIRRNQLVELSANFRNQDLTGEVEFGVHLDRTWDGSVNGGSDATH